MSVVVPGLGPGWSRVSGFTEFEQPIKYTHAVTRLLLGRLPLETICKLTHQNAAKVYPHPLPTLCRP